jgi:DNA-binding transcriptional ArsR family regulator
MVQFNNSSLDLIFSALGDPTRRAMLVALRDGDASIGDLARPHGITLAGAAKHVAVLAKAGLVDHSKVGRSRLCRLKPNALQAATDWINWHETFWEERLDGLERMLEEVEDE